MRNGRQIAAPNCGRVRNDLSVKTQRFLPPNLCTPQYNTGASLKGEAKTAW
nr:MAG TPA: hypothetical protein [Caudoviricetes sp.]